jgi:hypothetical protein
MFLIMAWAGQYPASSRDARTLHIAPSAAGEGSGSDWANAGSLENLSAFIALAGPGGKVLLKADDGPYRVSRQITVRTGGTDGLPVTVAGVDHAGKPAKAEIVGTRSNPWSLNGNAGSEVFRLASGANHLRFEQILFRDQGNGCFRIADSIRGLEIQDVDARNVRRFVENTGSGSEKRASVDGLLIRRVTVKGYSKGAIRLGSDSSNILIEDVVGDSERQDGDDFAIGVALQDSVHDVVLRRVTMMNSHDSTHEYWNGDGFTAEKNVRNVRFEDTLASGSTDGGYDLKSSETTLLRARAEDNMRNFRIWGESTIKDCVSSNPRKRGGSGKQNHIWVAKGAKVDVTECRIEDSDDRTTVFEVDRSGEITVRDSIITKNPDAQMSVVHDGGSLEIVTTR